MNTYKLHCRVLTTGLGACCALVCVRVTCKGENLISYMSIGTLKYFNRELLNLLVFGLRVILQVT
jgi:hypothetical protein